MRSAFGAGAVEDLDGGNEPIVADAGHSLWMKSIELYLDPADRFPSRRRSQFPESADEIIRRCPRGQERGQAKRQPLR
jgi:hypothetical protein